MISLSGVLIASLAFTLSVLNHTSLEHDGILTYNCTAGGRHNRLKSDYNVNTYNLTCLPENQFSTPTWPTCAASKSQSEYFEPQYYPQLVTAPIQRATTLTPSLLETAVQVV